MNEDLVRKVADMLHCAGIDAYTAPMSYSADEWNAYRVKIAERLLRQFKGMMEEE